MSRTILLCGMAVLERNPAQPKQKTLRQHIQHAYYMRNREKMKALALARYHANKEKV